LKGVDVAWQEANGKGTLRRRGPILFTQRGWAGPAPMGLAGDVEELAGGAQARFDFLPATSREQLEQQWLSAAQQHGARRVESVLPRTLPERMREALLQQSQTDRDARLGA